MNATVIRLANHRAIVPKVDSVIPHLEFGPSLSFSLDRLAQNVAVIACTEVRKGPDYKRVAICLWRLSEGLQELTQAADKLEWKYRKAKRRLERK